MEVELTPQEKLALANTLSGEERVVAMKAIYAERYAETAALRQAITEEGLQNAAVARALSSGEVSA